MLLLKLVNIAIILGLASNPSRGSSSLRISTGIQNLSFWIFLQDSTIFWQLMLIITFIVGVIINSARYLKITNLIKKPNASRSIWNCSFKDWILTSKINNSNITLDKKLICLEIVASKTIILMSIVVSRIVIWLMIVWRRKLKVNLFLSTVIPRYYSSDVLSLVCKAI